MNPTLFPAARRLLAAVASLLLGAAQAAAAAPAASSAPWPRLAVRAATLKNGLQVLVLERHTSPTVALYLHYRVGTVDERLGTLGLSHFLEHMLFKGSPRIGTRDYAREAPLIEAIDDAGMGLDRERTRGAEADAGKIEAFERRLDDLLERQRRHIIKDELTEILQRAGADSINASTWPDATNYFAVMPAGREQVWLAAMGEQMSRPVLREFYPERDVVMEERRLRVEDDPQGALLELAASTAFQAHPYRNSDWMSELERLTREDARRHYETYYGAGNAVLAVVGDVRFETVMPIIERHLGRLPRRPEPPEVRVVEPPQAGEKRARLELGVRPELTIAFHIPALTHADEPALALMSAALGGHGSSVGFESALLDEDSASAARWSRLHRRLVEGRGVAQDAVAIGYPGDRYPRLLMFLAEPREPHSLADLERALLEEIEDLRTRAVSNTELARARRNLRALYLGQLESNLGAAWLLGYTHGLTGDWRAVERAVNDLEKVGPADVQRVARAYLTERNRTVVWRVPRQEQEPSEADARAEGNP